MRGLGKFAPGVPPAGPPRRKRLSVPLQGWRTDNGKVDHDPEKLSTPLPEATPCPVRPRSRAGRGSGGDGWDGENLGGDALPPGAVRVALGRHALGLVALQLRAQGIHQIALPDYHCLTMLTPFQLEGLHIAHVRCGPDLLADPQDLLHTLGAEPARWAVLHCETFGARPSRELAQVLTGLRSAGGVLVVDATHTWPEEPHLPGDHVVASFRKFAGLPDGAFATGLDNALLPSLTRSTIDEGETLAWLRGDVDAAEDLMDAELSPAVMSTQASHLLAGLDLGALLARRRRRAGELASGLEELGLEVISPPEAHFCLAFRHPRAPELVSALARAGVDGPVWWPRPARWTREWPEDVVTLPLDTEAGPVGAGLAGSGPTGTAPAGMAASPDLLLELVRQAVDSL